MTDEGPPGRSIKLQLMVSAAELRAIDDWRFTHRYPSRAEAIRVLVRRALEAAVEERTPRRR
jgi:Arc/MetJ-type ribon-helix-helix transcriptional regulator